MKTELAWVKSLTGSNKHIWAWFEAHTWRTCMERVNKGDRSRELKSLLKNSIHRLGAEAAKAADTGNVDFLRSFADALESKCQTWDKVRLWLINKHSGPVGSDPRFTHKELIKDAAAHGIDIDERQLRRLMSELGFQFKNSRQ